MQELNDMITINEIINKEFSIIVLKTKKCSVCTPVSIQLEKLLQKYPAIEAYQIYADEVEEFAGQHLVFTVPTVLIFSSGNEILRESRFINFNKIERLINIYSN